jgi:hypothetical protein
MRITPGRIRCPAQDRRRPSKKAAVHSCSCTLAAFFAWPASRLTTAQLCQPAGVDWQQQRMKKQHGREVSEIGIGDEGQITGERHPTQRGHGTHAECRKHERGGDKTDSVDDRQVPHPAFLSVCAGLCSMRAAGSHSWSHRSPSRWQLPSDLGTAALGLARQLSRTGAARLTDVFITAERGSVSHACVPLENRKTFQRSDACSLRREPPWLRRNLREP